MPENARPIKNGLKEFTKTQGSDSKKEITRLIPCIIWVALAFSLSLYLGWASWKGGGVAGCGPNSGCDQVLGSKWSYVGPIPVSFGAILIDALWLLGLIKLASGHQQKLHRQFFLFCAALVGSSAVWFVMLQLLVLKAICPYCMVAHFCGLMAAVLTFRYYFGNTYGRGLALAGGILPTVVIGMIQVYFPHSTQLASVVPQQASPAVSENKERVLSLYNGAFKLKPSELPMLGSTNAEHIMVSLFDYTCHHCREMHGFLKRQLTNYPGQFGIISLPMPLDADCNWIMKKTPVAHANACNYAQLGLAVFLAAPTKSSEFDEWLFTGEKPPPIHLAQQRAKDIVGPEALKRALADEWVKSRIQEDISLYASNYHKIRKGQMPQLILGDLVSVGVISKQADFDKMVASQWGLTNHFPQSRLP